MRARTILMLLLLAAGPAGNAAPTDPCPRLESRLEALHLKLRLGYDARQGRVYRQQRDQLERQRRRLCRG